MQTNAEPWGRFALRPQRVFPVEWRGSMLPPASEGSILPFGQGRSYGDVAQNSAGTLLSTARLSRFISFDAVGGRLAAEGGVRLCDVHAVTAPQGWYLPVVPGTQFASLGGSLANDVHGKNHHRAGTFGDHVTSFELLRSDGRRLTCSRTVNDELFAATIGGLGLTGLVTRVELQLRRTKGPLVDVQTVPFGSVEEFIAMCETSDAIAEYTVAWFDCFSYRRGQFRGLFSSANEIEEASRLDASPSSRISVPIVPPVGLLHPLAMRTFNRLYDRMGRRGDQRSRVVPLRGFLYPLDGVGHWNRLYGPRGFLQFQCVVPEADAAAAISILLSRIAASGEGTFLAVLKRFGKRSSAGLLSFARPGVTLALDFPYRGEGTLSLMQALHAIVREAKGAIYPAKDAVMTPETFRASFPDWSRMEAFRDPRFTSDFWQRVSGVHA